MKKAGVEILDKPEDENVWEEKAMALWPISTPKSAISTSSTR